MYMYAWVTWCHGEMAVRTKNDEYVQKKTKIKLKWKKETKVALMRVWSFACTRPHVT